MNRPCQKPHIPKFSWVLVHLFPLHRTEPLLSLLCRTDVLVKMGDNEHFGDEIVLTCRADSKRYDVLEMRNPRDAQRDKLKQRGKQKTASDAGRKKNRGKRQ